MVLGLALVAAWVVGWLALGVGGAAIHLVAILGILSIVWSLIRHGVRDARRRG